MPLDRFHTARAVLRLGRNVLLCRDQASDRERDKILSGFTRYTTSTLRSTAMLDPSHPDTKVRCTGDDDTHILSIFYLTFSVRNQRYGP